MSQYSGEDMQEKLHMRLHPGINPEPFSAKIVKLDESSVYLSETFCYPRGGGQPGDTGLFSTHDGRNCPFKEVLPGDMIAHPVDNPEIFKIDDAVECSIDITRRNAHTMMHSAQHIFSALAEDIWGAETVGNQIGIEQSRVDLLFSDKNDFNHNEIVDAVNGVIHSSISVNVHNWPRDEILSHDQMRHTKFMHRIPSSITHLRVVEIEGVDLCPCAGTHVANTSSIPRVVFLSTKNKGKGRIRVSYRFE